MSTKLKVNTPIAITAPNLGTLQVDIRGTAPYVQNKFSGRTRDAILETQQQGSKSKSRKVRKDRDIEEDYRSAMHLTSDGRYGIPAAAFRSAMISACRLVGFQMTKAKLAIFVLADDLDIDDGMGLVYIDGEPEMNQSHVRLETGVTSVAIRPMWRQWSARIRITFDADQFSAVDVTNLLARAGMQVGVGEGRPDSKKSHGMGWGTFEVVRDEQ